MVKIERKFEEKLKEIFSYVVRYGAATEFSLNEKPEDFNYDRFVILCNKGFKNYRDTEQYTSDNTKYYD